MKKSTEASKQKKLELEQEKLLKEAKEWMHHKYAAYLKASEKRKRRDQCG